MKLFGWRVFVVVALPFAIAWSGAVRLAEGIADGFYFAWLDARNEISSARAMWRGNEDGDK